MKHFVVIFNKPVILPGDKLKKIKTYGVVFEKHPGSGRNIQRRG